MPDVIRVSFQQAFVVAIIIFILFMTMLRLSPHVAGQDLSPDCLIL
jgi:hypothetical protein